MKRDKKREVGKRRILVGLRRAGIDVEALAKEVRAALSGRVRKREPEAGSEDEVRSRESRGQNRRSRR